MHSPSHRAARRTSITPLLLAAGGIFGIGLILLLYGIFADPFSLPFQDSDLMPAAQVVRRVDALLVVRSIVLGTFVIGQRLRQVLQ